VLQLAGTPLFVGFLFLFFSFLFLVCFISLFLFFFFFFSFFFLLPLFLVCRSSFPRLWLSLFFFGLSRGCFPFWGVHWVGGGGSFLFFFFFFFPGGGVVFFFFFGGKHAKGIPNDQSHGAIVERIVPSAMCIHTAAVNVKSGLFHGDRAATRLRENLQQWAPTSSRSGAPNAGCPLRYHHRARNGRAMPECCQTIGADRRAVECLPNWRSAAQRRPPASTLRRALPKAAAAQIEGLG